MMHFPVNGSVGPYFVLLLQHPQLGFSQLFQQVLVGALQKNCHHQDGKALQSTKPKMVIWVI